MSNDDWNFDSSTNNNSGGMNDGFQEEAQKVQKIRGPWHWSLTIVALLLVGGFSFLMAYLTRDFPKREPWLMGLTFAVPMAAMFGASLLLEHCTCKMTPSYLRKKQSVIALAAVMATFLVGSLCNGTYMVRFNDQRTVFVLDKSSSMYGESDREMQDAMEQAFSFMDPNEDVGLVLFSSEVEATVPLAPLGEKEHQEELLQVLKECPPNGLTDFTVAMNAALQLIRDQPSEKSTKIIFLTDGYDSSFAAAANAILEECRALNVTVEGVAFSGDGRLDVMEPVISGTGGKTVAAKQIDQLMDVMVDLTSSNYDLLRSQEPKAKLMTGIMLGLEGTVIGLGLWLMLSVRGQLRAQMIISPVMGILGFVLMKYSGFNAEMEYWWVIEGTAFTLLGVVFMTQNRLLNPQKERAGNRKPKNKKQSPESNGGFQDNYF